MRKLVWSVVGVLLAVNAVAQSTRFEGDSIHLRLADDGKGSFTGEMTQNGATYPLTATGKLDGQLKGAFVANQTPVEFVAASTADGLTFETGGKTYHLKHVAAPAVVPPQITFKRVAIHDVAMNDCVSHTMYMPEGWSFQGRTEWSEGAIIFPQQNIEVRSRDGYSVRFVPALHLAYSEIDPDLAMQLKQNGLWNPQIHRERQGIKPPDNIGEFIVAYITRNNKAVSKVRLVNQKRDRDAEAAVRENNPGALGDTGEFHIINIEYERDGVSIREEINLIYGKSEPVRGPTGTNWPYSIVTVSMVSGPAQGFADAKPLLYSIATSLSATPEWYYASRQVLSEIQAARHVQNMEGIRRWGDAIRKAGEDNRKLSDARLKQWKDDQKIDDEKQRDRVRRIYDIYTVTTSDGSKVAVPAGYNHVYKTNDGKFIASQQEIPTNPNLTPVPIN